MQVKDNLLKKLGNRIKEVRLSKNLTQFDLASRIGKDQQSIQRLEAGRMNPTYFYLVEIATGLQIPLHELLQPLTSSEN